MPRTSRQDSAGDDALMAAIVARDPQALGSLFDRHSTTVFAASLRVLRDRDEAEDVVEDVFWELWQRPARFDSSRGPARAYLLVLARSRAQDRLRARGREHRQLDGMRERQEWTALSEGEGDTTPLDQVLSIAKRERVRRAFAGLKPAQREVLELQFFSGLTQAEVAQQLSLPLGTVKSRSRSGLGYLRELLTGPGSEEVA